MLIKIFKKWPLFTHFVLQCISMCLILIQSRLHFRYFILTVLINLPDSQIKLLFNLLHHDLFMSTQLLYDFFIICFHSSFILCLFFLSLLLYFIQTFQFLCNYSNLPFYRNCQLSKSASTNLFPISSASLISSFFYSISTQSFSESFYIYFNKQIKVFLLVFIQV